MVDDEVKDDDKYSKPGYDGRLQYHNTLRESMIRIRECMAWQDLKSWHIELQGLFNLTSPYIPNNHIGDCDKLFNIASRQLFTINDPHSYTIDRYCATINLHNTLIKLTRMIYNYSKHIMLPIKDETEDGRRNA